MRILTIFVLMFSLFMVNPVCADELILTHIGTMATQGKKYNQWWYEPQKVLLKGLGSKAANIDITLDGKFNTIRSNDTDGSWSYDLGSLSIADHSLIVASGDQSYSFVLTIGSAAPADMGTTKGGLPTAGGILPIIGLITLAGTLIYVGFKKIEA